MTTYCFVIATEAFHTHLSVALLVENDETQTDYGSRYIDAGLLVRRIWLYYQT